MYKFAARLTPEDLEAIAAHLYIELAKGGYTSVCEFHYVHHDANGRPFANRAEMSERLVGAATGVGIGLTLLPVLYQTANFGGVPPHAGQRRFVTTVDEFLGIVGTLRDSIAGDPNIRVGIAPHSLRAVPPDDRRRAFSSWGRVGAKGKAKDYRASFCRGTFPAAEQATVWPSTQRSSSCPQRTVASSSGSATEPTPRSAMSSRWV